MQEKVASKRAYSPVNLFRGRSISRDLTISLMVMILLVVASTLSWQYLRNSQAMLREVESKADEYITRLSDILSVPIWNFDTRTIDQIGTVFAQYDLVNEVRIMDPLGKVLFSTVKRDDADARVYRERDIMYEGEVIGHATVVLTLAGYKKDLSRLVTTNLLALSGVLVVILVATGILLRIHLRKPLEELLRGMGQVARGDFKFDFSVIQNAELGLIADNFAVMAAEVAAREKQLVEMNRQLEAQIRERERAEAALRQSEERYSLAVIATNDGIWDWDLRQDRVYYSTRWKAIIGYQDAEIDNNLDEWQGRMHPADLDRVLRAQDDYLSGVTEQFEVEYRMRHKDGEYRWILGRGMCVRDESGEPYRMAGAHTDITQRKQAERELWETKNTLDNILNSMPSTIVSVDKDARITQWNKTAEEVTGIAAAEAYGRPFADVLPRYGFLLSHITESIATGTNISLEKEAVTEDARTRYFDIIIYPVVTRGEFSAVIRLDDVTDRFRIEEMMVQTEKMLSVGGLAAGMAHEINNPLGGILQGTQNIKRRISMDFPANHKAAEEAGCPLENIRTYLESRGIIRFLEGITESGRRAADIVSNMLEFSRRSEARRSSVNLGELIDKTIELAANDYDLKKKYDFRHIEIVRQYDPTLPQVLCSPQEVEQVLLNLLKNAAQAMVERGDRSDAPRIVITTSLDRGRARIDVADNGPGMDEETRKRVFEPFFTTKAVGEGTGLGLSVSYFIITTNHEGQFTVDAEPGRGTTFTIRLPLGRR
ncbi:PAS domain-containing sensor histidine kinase [Desulfovibrio psychrotolerans]|uniref:histidine kinase n=1 Tax=Desulfovibrio psychrotolerans TaxID=415242 RepID=A0A7J0BXG8_9BACT|nr:PAS domain-containing sensor histidine kinase [Desulfovibrio psychrotolerans]GFM37872.1 histidine kinase [Desulfovibrio psychrotolerans]